MNKTLFTLLFLGTTTIANASIFSDAKDNFDCAKGLLGFDSGVCAVIRDQYNNDIDKIRSKFLEKAKDAHVKHQSLSDAEIERVSDERKVIKEYYQGITPMAARYAVYVRNLLMYGKAEGPSYDDIVLREREKGDNGKTPEEIAYGALGTDGGNLGLGNNGFKDIKKVYFAIKKIKGIPEMTGYYPEVISTEEAMCFNKLVEGGIDDEYTIDQAISQCGITSVFMSN